MEKLVTQARQAVWDAVKDLEAAYRLATERPTPPEGRKLQSDLLKL